MLCFHYEGVFGERSPQYVREKLKGCKPANYDMTILLLIFTYIFSISLINIDKT